MSRSRSGPQLRQLAGVILSTPIKRFVQHSVHLACGAVLPKVVTAYLTRGQLAADRNAILVTHGYTGGPDMIDPDSELADGSWSELIGPGKAIDTDRYFVVCPNALGSSYGSTNASTIDPQTGQAYGSKFPDIAMSDIVAGQRALVEHWGISRLHAVIGHSFGGAQVFQWGVDHPDMMDLLASVISAPKMGGVDVPSLQKELSADPNWHGGDYYGVGDMKPMLAAKRFGTLKAFGADTVLADRFPDPQQREKELHRLARQWADQFDANSLLILYKTMAGFDVTGQLDRIRAPLLFALSRSDRIIPASKAPQILDALSRANVKTIYHEIDSDHGHSAAGTDAAKWSSVLRDFLNTVGQHSRATQDIT